MAMKNYKVAQEDGTETIYQFDEADDVGKQQLQILRDAAKNDDSTVKSVAAGEPEPINGKS